MGGRSQISRKMTVTPVSLGGSIYDNVYSFRTLGELAYHGRSMWPSGVVHFMLEHKQKEETRVQYHLSVYFSNVQSPHCASQRSYVLIV